MGSPPRTSPAHREGATLLERHEMEDKVDIKKPEKSKKIVLAELAEKAPVFMCKRAERYAFFKKDGNTFYGPDAAIYVADIDGAIKYLQGISG